MSNTPPYLLGRHLAVQAAPVSVDESTGALTPGTLTSFTAFLDGLAGRSELETEEINSLASTQSNPVPLRAKTTYEVTEIMRNAASPSVLRQCFQTSAYIVVKVTDGVGGSMTLYGLVTRLGRQAGRGKNSVTARIESIDIGAVNPAFGA